MCLQPRLSRGALSQVCSRLCQIVHRNMENTASRIPAVYHITAKLGDILVCQLIRVV